MKKTSIYLDPALDAALALRAEEEGLTKAELIRRSLEATIDRPKRPRPRAIGIVKGGPPEDISGNKRAYLLASDFGELPPERRR